VLRADIFLALGFAASARPAARNLGGILPTHRRAAFASATRANMRFALALLLIGFASCFLDRGSAQAPRIFALALIFGGASFAQGDRDGLATALYFTALALRPTAEFAVFELVHDTAGGLSLAWGCFRHRYTSRNCSIIKLESILAT
jgi:hypothetical protein